MATSHEIVIDGKPLPATDFQNAPDMATKGKDSNHLRTQISINLVMNLKLIF